MAEDFHAAGINCGGTWWNPSKSMFAGCMSPYFTGLGGADIGNNTFGWQNLDSTGDMKYRLSSTENIQNNSKSSSHSVSDSSIVFAQKQQEVNSDSGSSSVPVDSTLQMMGLGFSSSGNSSSDWNQPILQEDINSSLIGTSPDCQGFFSTGFPISQSVNLLQNLYEPESSSCPQNNNRSINTYMSNPTTSCSNDNLPSRSWPKTDPFLKQTLVPNPKHQTSGLNLSNTNTPFCNSSVSNLNNIRTSSFIPSSQLSSRLEEKSLPCHNITTTTSTISEVRDHSGSATKKASNEPATKKLRIATPSPLPTFKVRKENLRDQITALQQLVSPFGKTDTASVLQEGIEYIKFLHDQVSVLSTPYMKQGGSFQPKQTSDKSKDTERNNQDLRSRGLCLVPISSTVPVANDTTAEFWTPTLGGNFCR